VSPNLERLLTASHREPPSESQQRKATRPEMSPSHIRHGPNPPLCRLPYVLLLVLVAREGTRIPGITVSPSFLNDPKDRARLRQACPSFSVSFAGAWPLLRDRPFPPSTLIFKKFCIQCTLYTHCTINVDQKHGAFLRTARSRFLV